MFIKPSGQKKNLSFVSGKSRPSSSQSYTPRVPHWWGKENMGLKRVVICPRCQAIYYDKHWHSWENTSRGLPKDLKTSETLCRACAVLAANKDSSANAWGGEAVFFGLKELNRRLEAVNLIKNIGARATRRDPEAQIIKIEDKGDSLRVTTTGNQLAIAIGKQIDAAFKGGKLSISWSSQNLPARVRWTAPVLK